MELEIGDKIRYTSAAGTLEAFIKNIKVGRTADPKRFNTWLILDVPAQRDRRFSTSVQIPADNGSIKAFKIVKI